MMKKLILLPLFAALVACAPIQPDGSAADPLEPFNRQMFAFNEVVDTLVLKPVAQTYRVVVPSYGRTAVSNAVRNFYEPVTMVNAFMQGDVDRGFTAFWRFILNTTLGGLGIYDFAGENTELKYRREDFGQTLGVWAGHSDSAYLVLPIFGPSSTRDAFGRVVDIVLNPWNHGIDSGEAIAVAATGALSGREEALDLVDEIYDTSFDPYVTIRSAYEQRRKAQIENRYTDKEE